MKTFNQQTGGKVISLDEIIFAGRNQEYGSYMLRKNSKKHILQAFSITLLIIAPLFLIGYFQNKPAVNNPVEISTSITMEKIEKNAITPPPPPPLPKNLQNILRESAVGTPVVVDSVPLNQITEFPINTIPPVNTGNTPKVIYTDNTDTVTDIVEVVKPYIKVEEDATFQGGTLFDFCIWVSQHIKYPDNAALMDIHGKVIIQFVVNTKGKTEDIKIIKGIDELLNNEAVKAVAASPKWRPARQQGNNVKQQFTIPIVFKLKEM